jgi:hypothetical protein
MGFIYRIPMFPKNDGSQIACEVAIFYTFVDDITIEVCFLLF